MASYPLAFPSIGVVQSSFGLHRVVSESASPFTGSAQRYRHPGEWWEGQVTFRTARRADAGVLKAFLAELEGKFGSFLYGDPDALAQGPAGSPVIAALGTINYVRNGQATGAVIGNMATAGALPTNWNRSTAAGLAWEIIGSGVDGNGLGYVDIRLSGTTAATSLALRSEATTQTAGVQGEIWTASAYCALVAGSMANITAARVQISERDAAGASLFATSSAFALVAAVTRASVTRTLSSATAAFVTSEFSLTFASGVAIDATFRLGGFQIEKQATATPYVPTTNAVASRPAGLTVRGAGQTGNVLNVHGFDGQAAGRLKKGDYFQLGTGASARLYMVTQDVASDVAGRATLNIAPRLRSIPADGAAVIVAAPKGVFKLTDNATPWPSDANGNITVSINFVEDL